ncbi:M81 family metallopeptidase [Evansella halocellulosilytica]|uniref:M81 family metallopeptidase n=1 Tax=Evansella halocellulosilytica TaxID=2011013 RepID=UPI000BB7197A|nr:M81 family metallopeptidase [Evansella halocellulosilytica]
MKILIGQIAHETNTFSSVKTDVAAFQKWEWSEGTEVIENHKNVKDYLGGMIDRANELKIEVLPTFSAFAMPSGIITSEANERMKRELITKIEEYDSFDAVCLALHGAGVAEDTDDLEGDILEEVRQVIGNEIPIVVTLDLHGNLSNKMVEHASVLLGVNYYPHIDCYDRGVEAVDVIMKILSGELKPSMALKTLPLMIPTSTTNHSPANEINEICWKKEQEEEIVDCTFFHGFPYTDIPQLGVSVLTVTNDNLALAEKTSHDVCEEIWKKKESFFPDIFSPAEGVQHALQLQEVPVVINETSDNPGGGTPGDGTHLLRALLEHKVTNACFGFICDKEVVETAHSEGVGESIKVLLGGKTDDLHGEPLQVTAYIKTLSDGKFIQSSPMGRGSKVNYGKSARLVIDGVDVIVCSKQSQVLDEQIFLLHGIEVNNYKIVALKSSQHFRAGFEPITKSIITVDSPGLSSFQLTSFNHTRLKKPMYPLSKEVSFEETKTNI